MTDAWAAGDAPSHPWRSGRWSLDRRGGELADIAVDGRVVLRAAQAVVRDRDWNTVPGAVESADAAGETLTLALRWSGLGADLDGTVTVTARGDVLEIALEAVSHTAFDTNRTGLVVLQPPSVAGGDLVVTHPDGSIDETAFPRRISPHQPVLDIAALAWRAADVAVQAHFDGDVFEMEDQRNWTDASFKVYSRPLALPFPYRLDAGARVAQTIVLRAGSATGPAVAAPPDLLVLRPAGAFPEIVVGAATAPDPAPGALRADEKPLPRRDTSPRPVSRHGSGFSRAGDAQGGDGAVGDAQAGDAQAGDAQAGDAPVGDAILVELDLAAPPWRAALARAAASGLPLDVRLVVADPGDDDAPLTDESRAALADAAAALAGMPVRRIAAFTRVRHTTAAPIVAALGDALAAVGLEVPVLGGVRSHFTELNREHDLVPDDVDGITFAVTPLFHALSTAQLVESLAMQRLVAHQAVEIAAGRPVHVGPVTLRPRFNDVATGPQPAPLRGDLAEGYGAAFTGAPDPRQGAAELAAWTVASAAALAVPGVASVAFFEEWGPLGIRTADGAALPALEALRALAALDPGDRLVADSPDGLVWAIGSRAGTRTVALVANLSDAPRRLALDLDGTTVEVEVDAGAWTEVRPPPRPADADADADAATP